MAEINTSTSQRKNLRTQCTKLPTKVDLTPMVDLGFILITFFIFTATLARPKAMDLMVPNDTDSSTDKICESCAITFLPGGNNQLYYYEGKKETAIIKKTDYLSTGIRHLLTDKKKRVKQSMLQDKMVVIIKPGAASSFKNLVDIIDECKISVVKRYYIDEVEGE